MYCQCIHKYVMHGMCIFFSPMFIYIRANRESFFGVYVSWIIIHFKRINLTIFFNIHAICLYLFMVQFLRSGNESTQMDTFYDNDVKTRLICMHWVHICAFFLLHSYFFIYIYCQHDAYIYSIGKLKQQCHRYTISFSRSSLNDTFLAQCTKYLAYTRKEI